MRHICWGIIVNQHGYEAISKSLVAYVPNFSFVSWSGLPFNYPIITLLFDQFMAWLAPSIFAMKVALTIIELANASLIYKYTQSRLLATLYWISPISIWWVSREGQFEPLQSLFIILALILFKREKWRNFAWATLALGIQVKLTAVFLLPYFIAEEPKVFKLAQRFVFFGLALFPTVALSLIANPLSLIMQSFALKYNPYYWNIFHSSIFSWNPTVLIAMNQITSYYLLFSLLIYMCIHKNCWHETVPTLLFLFFLKTSQNAQFWYLLSLPPFLLTISNYRVQLFCLLLLPIMDTRSCTQIFLGPWGNIVAYDYSFLKDGSLSNIMSVEAFLK